ncbi:MAG: hypothetical protein J0H49_05010 [Acidobacteria bacterium]|nr:hypothetical protein [Acidobacteriota bacterium]
MHPPDAVPELSEDQQLFEQLMEWSGLSAEPNWQAIAAQPAARAQIVNAVKQLAALPNAQAETGAPVQFVLSKHVFNLRPLVKTAVIAVLVKTSILISPGLESPLLHVLEAIHFLEDLHGVYQQLSDDEVDVFGATVELYSESELRRGISDPAAHPTAAGVTAWFAAKGYEAPPNVDRLLESLVKKGALLGETLPDGSVLYEPTFLGRKKQHE